MPLAILVEGTTLEGKSSLNQSWIEFTMKLRSVPTYKAFSCYIPSAEVQAQALVLYFVRGLAKTIVNVKNYHLQSSPRLNYQQLV